MPPTISKLFVAFCLVRFLMTDFLWVRKLKLQLTLLPLHFVVNTPRTRKCETSLPPSKGGMSNEMYNNIARVTDGIYEDIAIGGNVFPGSNLLGQNYKKDCAKTELAALDHEIQWELVMVQADVVAVIVVLGSLKLDIVKINDSGGAWSLMSRHMAVRSSPDVGDIARTGLTKFPVLFFSAVPLAITIVISFSIN
uniref:Uncharacterized protein n=1 Tax=Cucumis melo TaxID=3656 RepID=A0A9I9EBF7_CUCME